MLIVFDLDGTLIDSAEDLAIATNTMRKQFGLGPMEPATIQSYVGNGASVLVQRALGEDASQHRIEQGLAFFLDYYSKHSVEYTSLYSGVQSLVEDLRSMDHTLAVLSNKPAQISTDILTKLRINQHFFRIYGGDSFPTKKPDATGLLSLMREAAVSAREVLMIGDSPVDVHTARNAGVGCCGVLWGFQPHAVQASGPDRLIAKPHQLLAYI